MKNGFTIVEMLVAISILVVGVLGPLGVATRGISDGIYAKNQVAATYLAQEAMEVFINTRNSNTEFEARQGNNSPRLWLDGIDDDLANSKSSDVNCIDTVNQSFCFVDAFAQSMVSSGNVNFGLIDDWDSITNDFRLQFCEDEDIGRYQRKTQSCSSWSGPIFTRWVEVTAPETINNEIKVEVHVTWQNKGVNKSLVLEGYLYHLNNGSGL